MASSCCVIQYLSLFQDGIPEIPAEKLGGIEVYLPLFEVIVTAIMTGGWWPICPIPTVIAIRISGY